MKRHRLIDKSKSITLASSPVQRLALFGPPLLLEGEDAAAYDVLLARICAAVKPVDIIDEVFINDVVVLQWEVLRWRRLKLSLISARGLEALTRFLEIHRSLCTRKTLPRLYGKTLGKTKIKNLQN